MSGVHRGKMSRSISGHISEEINGYINGSIRGHITGINSGHISGENDGHIVMELVGTSVGALVPQLHLRAEFKSSAARAEHILYMYTNCYVLFVP